MLIWTLLADLTIAMNSENLNTLHFQNIKENKEAALYQVYGINHYLEDLVRASQVKTVLCNLEVLFNRSLVI
jgi:hypothetical protein